MKTRLSKSAYIAIVLILLLTTGYLREFFFVNVNEQLLYLWYENEVSPLSDNLWFLSGFDYQTLYYSKWVFTIFFAMIFLLETSLALRLIYNRWYIKEVSFIYALLFFLSGLLFGVFALSGSVEDGYLISRYFMGLAQSPVPTMILACALFLRQRLMVKA
jgi:hypothetical protein